MEFNRWVGYGSLCLGRINIGFLGVDDFLVGL